MATPKAKTAEKAPAQKKPVAAAAPKAAVPADTRNALEKRRTIEGTVVSDKMKKTIVVEVDRQVRHGLYEKYLVRSNRYKAHDETNQAKMGDRVRLVESKPLSR